MVKNNKRVRDAEFADFLSEFIDWERRALGEGYWLFNMLDKYGCRKIFESCMGEGFDSIRLAKAGFDVTSNDVDEKFIQMAIATASSEGIELKVVRHDWRGLPDDLTGQFDAVLNMGNSLTYMMTRGDQGQALENFCKVLRPGGILVLDHRNYDYMLDEREHILLNPRKNFRYSGRYYYSNEKIEAYPVAIDDNRVVLQYLRKATGAKIEMEYFPLRLAYVYGLLEEAGFRVIETYSDFTLDKSEDADFYQHVARKRL